MRYTLVHGFCFFKLFLIGCMGLSKLEAFDEYLLRFDLNPATVQ